MSKKKKALVAVFALLGVVALGLAGVVYAKYIASFERTGGAKIAKWDFKGENTSYEFKCDLDKTYTNVKAAAEGQPIIIAPGTKGVCEVTLSNKNSEVAVHYDIALKDTGTNVPTNLKVHGASLDSAILSGLGGDLAIGEENKKVQIDWEWPYETGDAVTDGALEHEGDADDTEDGEAGANMSLTFVVTGYQKLPQ